MTTETYREARRTALILSASQAVAGSASPIAISMGGLAGMYLLGADKSLATAPVTGFTVGIAIGALPAAMLMRAVGRRYGFITGTGITALGGMVAATALFEMSFWIFALGLLFIGIGNAFVQQYRFAAADNADRAFKPKAIAWVMAGGIFAAIIGPQTVIFTREIFAPVSFAGAFVAVVFLAAIAAFILSFLRLPKDVPVELLEDDEPARPLLSVVRQPRFVVAMGCGIASYALMAFVMTGAPIAMVGCGFSPDDATLGISWHVLAMFAPSFVTGHLIQRFGKESIVAAGLLILMACAAVALSGIALWQFWIALILLGIGWNFGFIGATAIVTECYRRSERNKVQGFHDFILFSFVALASLLSGQVYNAWGWDMLNWIIFPITAICLLTLLAQVILSRRLSVRHAKGDADAI